ncbi:helicase-associated domain-containing protein [Corynebacterium mayonis]|uniref:helicase-associated domain-containing protein n=1 Tax=Corynebacterium mayonis TaxID=3062461 RepID=UPI00313FEC2F
MSDFLTALAEMTQDELRELVRARPDATFPIPPSLSSLATRLALPASLARALRDLNAADLAVLETAGDLGAELEPVPADSLGGHGLDVAGCVDKLRRRGLMYGPNDALRIVPGALSSLPAGWRILDRIPDNLEEKLAALSDRQRKVIETLAAAGGVGLSTAPTGPAAELTDLGLLVRVDDSTVRLPRPVREALRGLSPRIFPFRPAASADCSGADAQAAAAGLQAVREVRQVLMHLLSSPVALNKDGSLGVRASATLEKSLGFSPAVALTTAEAAGLIGRGDDEGTDVLAATRDGLKWMELTRSDQWAVLLAGWVASPWRADRADEVRLFADEMRVPSIRAARLALLRSAGGDIHHNLLFSSPVVASGMSPKLIGALIAEAQHLGALVGPCASSPARALLTHADVAAAAKDLVPAEATYVIAQADMTVLAPGPLPPEMATVLESFATLESPGLASVYRVTEESIRSALNAGRTAAELIEWLKDHAAGEVPQALTFLIADVARHHGSLRVGQAVSYVRCADPALIAEAARKVASLRVLAPTVAVGHQPLPRLLAELREAGLQPSAEDSTGATLNVAPEPVLVRPTPSTLPRERHLDEHHVDRVLAALREKSTEDSPDSPDNPDTVTTLKAAVRARRHVLLGYVDKNGRGRTLTALPLSVTAGQADLVDAASGKVVRIALPRVTKAVLA